MATFVGGGISKSIYHLRPSLQLKPIVNIPFNRIPGTFDPSDGDRVTYAIMRLVPTLYIWLDTLLDENGPINQGRSLSHDQLDIFNQIETTIGTFGVDGKSCMMRTI